MDDLKERMGRLELSVAHLEENLEKEMLHIDEIMALHREAHNHEHHMHQESVKSATDVLEGRLSEFRHSINHFNESLGTVVPRETIESKFDNMSSHMRRIEEDMVSIKNQIAAIAGANAQADKNMATWVAMGLVVLTVLLTTIMPLLIGG